MRLVRDTGIWTHICMCIDVQQKSNKMCRIIIREQKHSPNTQYKFGCHRINNTKIPHYSLTSFE